MSPHTEKAGPSPIFPIAGALLAAAMLADLTQREFRDFGTLVAPDTPEPPEALAPIRPSP